MSKIDQIDKYHIYLVDQGIKPGAFFYGFTDDTSGDDERRIANLYKAYIKKNYPNLSVKVDRKGIRKFYCIWIYNKDTKKKCDKNCNQDEVGESLGYKYQGKFENSIKYYHRVAYDIRVKVKSNDKYKQLFTPVDLNLKYKKYYVDWVTKIKESLMSKFDDIEDVKLDIRNVYDPYKIAKKLATTKRLTKNEQKYILDHVEDECDSFSKVIGPQLDFKNPLHRGLVIAFLVSKECKYRDERLEEILFRK